jgi:hypothetical protein
VTSPAYTLQSNATLRGKEVFIMKAVVKKTKAAAPRKAAKAPAKKAGKGRA